MFVQLESCISFARIRTVSRSGSLELKALFSGSEPQKYDCIGPTLGSAFPLVASLKEILNRYVTKYYRKGAHS